MAIPRYFLRAHSDVRADRLPECLGNGFYSAFRSGSPMAIDLSGIGVLVGLILEDFNGVWYPEIL
jgi:hypothetical protein